MRDEVLYVAIAARRARRCAGLLSSVSLIGVAACSPSPASSPATVVDVGFRAAPEATASPGFREVPAAVAGGESKEEMAPAVVWRRDERTARQESATSRTPLVVVLTASWSPASATFQRELEAQTPAASDARRRLRRAIPLLLDVSDLSADGEHIAASYELGALPAVLILDEGQEIGRLEGPTRPDEVSALLERAGL